MAAASSPATAMLASLCRFGVAGLLLLGGPIAKAQEVAAQPSLRPDAEESGLQPHLEFRVPALDKVVFRGVFSLDHVGMPQHAMLYPAFGLAGFVGSLVAHALIIEMGKEDQRTQAEKDADRVLDSLQPAIAGLSTSSLIAAAIEQSAFQGRGSLLKAGQADRGGWVLDAAPIIWVTQDKMSLISDTHLSIKKPGAKDAWQGRVRVISDRIETDDPVAHWLADSGAPLKLAGAKLMGRTVEIGLKYAQLDPKDMADLPFQTVRFTLEGRKKVERAQVLQQGCDYHLLKTLRGDYYAVPTSKLALDEDASSARCPLAAEPAKPLAKGA